MYDTVITLITRYICSYLRMYMQSLFKKPSICENNTLFLIKKNMSIQTKIVPFSKSRFKIKVGQDTFLDFDVLMTLAVNI